MAIRHLTAEESQARATQQREALTREYQNQQLLAQRKYPSQAVVAPPVLTAKTDATVDMDSPRFRGGSGVTFRACPVCGGLFVSKYMIGHMNTFHPDADETVMTIVDKLLE